MSYNGWTNYATWAAYTWLTSEEATYNQVRELEPDELRLYVGEAAPELEPSLYKDLLEAALQDVNWREVHEVLTE